MLPVHCNVKAGLGMRVRFQRGPTGFGPGRAKAFRLAPLRAVPGDLQDVKGRLRQIVAGQVRFSPIKAQPVEFRPHAESLHDTFAAAFLDSPGDWLLSRSTFADGRNLKMKVMYSPQTRSHILMLRGFRPGEVVLIDETGRKQIILPKTAIRIERPVTLVIGKEQIPLFPGDPENAEILFYSDLRDPLPTLRQPDSDIPSEPELLSDWELPLSEEEEVLSSRQITF